MKHLRAILVLACVLAPAPSGADALQAPTARTLPPFPAPTASYALRAILDPAHHTIAGSGKLTFRNRTQTALSEVWLHLYLNAFKNDRSVFLRTPSFSGRGQGFPDTWGAIDLKKFALGGVDLAPRAELHRENDEDETDVRIPLPTPIAPDQEVTFEMEWEDTLPTVVERTGFRDSFHMAGQWFPKLAVVEPDGTWAHFPLHHFSEFYADFGTYDVTIEAPRAFSVLATGAEDLSASQDDAAPIRFHRFHQEGVHDFAFAAWDQGEESREVIDGVEVRFLVPKGATDVLEREKETLRFALPHFRERYGPYPYTTLSVVHPPDGAEEAGGMEYPTLITTGSSRMTPAAVRSLEVVTLHEFGHQYFFGLLASNELASPFLDEGLNSYAEQEALAAWGPRGDVGSLLGLRVSGTAVHRVSAGLVQGEDIVAQPASAFTTGRHYGGLVYSQTSQVLETAARVYGKEKMQQALRTYAETFRFRHPTPKDFFAHLKTHLDPAAATFVEQALTTRATIDYAILGVSTGDATGASGLFDAAGKREMRSPKHGEEHHGSIAITRKGELSIPVDVLLEFADGTSQSKTFDARIGTLTFRSAARLVRVTLDPEQKITLDSQPRNNVWGTSRFPWQSAGWVSFLTQAALGVLP